MNRYLPYTLLVFFSLILSCGGPSGNESKSQNTIERFFTNGENASLEKRAREASLDSAYAAFSDNKNDSLTRYYYRRATVAYYDLALYDKSLRIGHKVYDMGAEARDSLTMAKASYFSGISHSEKGNNDSAFYYYQQAEKLYTDLKDRSLLGEIGLYKAYIFFNIGEYVKCESEGIKALRLLEEKQSTIDIYKCENLIGSALFGQDNYEEAIKYFRLALGQLENLKKEGNPDNLISTFKAYCYNNLGRVYVKQGDYRQALSIYEEALDGESIKTTGASLYAKLVNNLAYAKFKSGQKAGISTLLFESLKIRDSIKDEAGVVASNISLGEYYAAQGDTARAISYIKRGYDGATKIKSNDDILASAKLLSDIDPVNGAFYAEQYIDVSNRLQDAAKANREKFARIEYETDKLLNEKEELARKNSFIIGIAVIVLLFVAAIFMIYYLNSRNKELLLIQEQQKANEEIYQLMFEQQAKIESARHEEKSRIAMELHDGILNNIYAVRLNLEFINKKADDESIIKRKEYIKELQNVESEIRAVSHDLSRNAIFNQGQDFEAILRFMITSQKNAFGTDFTAEIDPEIDWDTMANTYKVNIYRIVQEALQNINKYSNASHAHVTVRKESSGMLGIVVTDDGVGFDIENIKGGIGLKNLRKRADSLNGTLQIDSEPGKGAKVEVLFPVA